MTDRATPPAHEGRPVVDDRGRLREIVMRAPFNSAELGLQGFEPVDEYVRAVNPVTVLRLLDVADAARRYVTDWDDPNFIVPDDTDQLDRLRSALEALEARP